MQDLSQIVAEVRDLFTEEISLHGPFVPQVSFSDHMRAMIPQGNAILARTSLQEIRDYVKHTHLTPIDTERKNAVPGEGSSAARIVVIGEAPGAQEDRQGKPFVGRAGQLLDKMLAAIGFARQDLFITNILKTRPPENRDPTQEEVEAHIPILYQQLAIINPLVILCLGRHAGRGLLKSNASLKSMRGMAHDYFGASLYVTYHPAALLRNPQWKRPAWEDLQMFRQRYDTLNQSAGG